VLIEFKIGEYEFEGVFMISSQLVNDAIIGCQLLKEYGININFGRGTIGYVRNGIYKLLNFEKTFLVTRNQIQTN
jgi:predicted aspartyl protease